MSSQAWVGLIQLVDGLNRTKRTTLLQVRDHSFLLDCIQTGTLAFYLQTQTETSALPGPQAWLVYRQEPFDQLSSFSGFLLRLELSHQLSWVSSLLTQFCRSWDLPASIIVEPILYNKYLYLFFLKKVLFICLRKSSREAGGWRETRRFCSECGA